MWIFWNLCAVKFTHQQIYTLKEARLILFYFYIFIYLFIYLFMYLFFAIGCMF